MSEPEKILGVLGAMPEEVDRIIGLMQHPQEVQIGNRTYHMGYIHQTKIVVAFSRWGKVAAASAAATLILKFNVSELIFTGVAGAINPNLHIGDIVIGQKLYQHDMDARPLMKQFEIPLTGMTYFESHTTTLHLAFQAAEHILKPTNLDLLLPPNQRDIFGITNPQIHVGNIASGDKFFATTQDKTTLSHLLPHIQCVEMEGAAVAQTCYEFNIPFSVIRIISDVADESAPIDFPLFIKTISGTLSAALVEHIIHLHQNTPMPHLS
jgi:adenosylhomocysteine nucleosidase